MAYISLSKSISGRHLFYFISTISVLSVLSLFQQFIAAFVVALVTTLFLGYNAIPVLKEVKFGQVIRKDGPQSHQIKSGTPTLGGVFLILPVLAISLAFSKLNSQVVACSLLTFSYFMIGFADDYKIIKEKSSDGLSPKVKLIFQTLAAMAFVGWEIVNYGSKFNYLDTVVNIHPVLYFFLGVFVLVGYSNSTNLTDGLDGLCSGVTLIVSLLAALLIAPFNPNLALMLVVLSGSCLGFMFFNSNPAKVFMGDTGSLAIGGLLGSIALLSGQILPFCFFSLFYIIETISVIAQVSYFKYTRNRTGTGKRLLKMAPFHHHLEKCGFSEVNVNLLAYTFTLVIGSITLTKFL